MTHSAGYGRNAGKRWRYDDIQTLRMLARQGAPVRLISLRLGRPDKAVRAKAEALNLHLEPSNTQIAPPPKRTLTRRGTAAKPVFIQPAPKTAQGDLFSLA